MALNKTNHLHNSLGNGLVKTLQIDGCDAHPNALYMYIVYILKQMLVSVYLCDPGSHLDVQPKFLHHYWQLYWSCFKRFYIFLGVKSTDGLYGAEFGHLFDYLLFSFA